MTERPIKPIPDGLLIIHRIGVGGEYPDTFRFSEIRHYNHESYGLVICTDRERRVFPWQVISEVRERFNSDEYVRLIQQWAELDHPNHTEEEPEESCAMCAETKQSNAMRMFFNGGTL